MSNFFQGFSPWIFEVQQTFSVKWLRQRVITTQKGIDYVSLKTSEKNLKGTLISNMVRILLHRDNL